MPKITVLDNEYATLWYHEDSKIVHQIHKFMPKGLYQELVTAGLDCLEKHNAIKWLSDNRQSPVVRQEDMDWTSMVSVPRAKRAGFKFGAIVMPVKAIGKMQMRELIEEVGSQGITLKAFSDPDEARKWLESVG